MAKDRTTPRSTAGFQAYLLLLLLALPALCLPGTNQWTSLGPEGGYVTMVAWHPARSQVAFAVTDRVFRTTDNGAHWSAVTDRLSAHYGFGFHPGNADRVLVAGNPLLSSMDGGATFNVVPGDRRIDSLAVSADGAAVFGAAANKVYRSADFGQTWTEIATPIPTTGDFPGQIAISPGDPNTLFLRYSEAGLFKSTDAGVHWTQVTGLTGNVNYFAINPNNGQQILAATGSNMTLWRSIDGGATWSASVAGSYLWIAYDPLVPNRVVANQYQGLDYSTDGGGLWFAGARSTAVQKSAGAFSSLTPGKLITGTSAGVEVSTDAGMTLQFRNTGLMSSELRAVAASRGGLPRTYASFFGGPEGLHLLQSGAWQTTGGGALMAAMQARIVIESIAVDPADSSTAYATGWSGMAKTTDGGVSWARVLQTSSYVMGSAVDPVDPRILYAASSTQGILRSPDGGGSWAQRNTGLPVTGGNVAMQSVFVHPLDPLRLYATDSNVRGLYRSDDAGLNWVRVAGGLPSNLQTWHVEFDPLDANRLYVATNDGLYQSTNAGTSWTRMSLPLNGPNIAFIEIDPAAPHSLLVGMIGANQRVIRTVDYGASWESLLWDAGPDNDIMPRSAVLDPAHPGSIVVGASRRGTRQFQVAPDLALDVSGVGARVQLGTTPTLSMTARNKTSSLFAASSAEVVLNLPAALTPGTVTTTRGSCTRTGQSISCRMGAMKVGETAQIDVPLTVANGSGNIVASIQGREVDQDPGDNAVNAAVVVQPFADLRATLSPPATANHGGMLTLDAQVTNLGPQGAVDARAVFTLPAGLSASSNGICTAAGTVVTCELGTLPVNGGASIQLAPVASAIGQYNVALVADSGSFDPDATNDSAAAIATVRPVTDLAVTLNGPATLPVGQVGVATATLTNAGPDPVNVAVLSLSGTNLGVSAATVAAGSCAISAGGATCSLGSLPAGASRSVEVSFTPSATGAAQLVASASSEALDSASANNSASHSLTGTVSANLGLTLAATPAAINRQSSTTLTARVTNAGPTAAAAARLVIALPAGLAASAATPSAGTCTVAANAIDCALGNLDNGAIATVDVSATAATTGSASVTASLTSPSFDPVAGNNAAATEVIVRGLTDLAISMTPLPVALQAGQTATTTITVINNGPDDAAITVATLSAVNLDVQSLAPSAGTCSTIGASTDCSLGALASGTSRTIAVTVAARSGGAASLSAAARFEGGERVSTDNTATVSSTVSGPQSGGGAGSGGGGALGGWGLLALLSWVIRRRARYQPVWR